MAEFKATDFGTRDLVTQVAAMSGLGINSPENQYLCRLALTEAQEEICNLQRWSWLQSTGSFIYSANASTFNMYSVSAGKYVSFAGFAAPLNLGRLDTLPEKDAVYWQRMRFSYSTASYPVAFMRVGDASFAWLPRPTAATSVSFTFYKRPGFVHGDHDVIIPKRYVLTALAHLARNKVWSFRADQRADQPDKTFLNAIQAMQRDEWAPPGDEGFRAWYPHEEHVQYDPFLSGFNST